MESGLNGFGGRRIPEMPVGFTSSLGRVGTSLVHRILCARKAREVVRNIVWGLLVDPLSRFIVCHRKPDWRHAFDAYRRRPSPRYERGLSSP